MKESKSSKLKILALMGAFLAFAIFAPVFAYAQDQLSVSKIEVSDIKNGSAVIKWRTPNAKTAGVVYVGASADKFDWTYRYESYAYDHSISAGKLEKNKTYFYKIAVFGRDGGMREMFIRSFSTGDMADTEKPKFLDFEVVQGAYESAVIRWTTNEKTSASINYGISVDKLTRKASPGTFSAEHEIILYKLASGTKNYVKVTAADKEGNTASRIVTVTPSGKEKDAALKVSNIVPAYLDSSRVSARGVRITYATSLPAKSRIRYGITSKILNKWVDVSTVRDLRHAVELEELEPRTTYFYQIDCYDSIYRKRTVTDILSFDTGDMSVRYSDGSLLHTGVDNKIYIISGDTRAWIENPAVFLGLGFKSEWVQDVPASALMDYKEAKSVGSSKRHPNGCLIKYAGSDTVYLLEDGKKRPIASAEAFTRNGFKWERVITIPKREFYTTGKYIS